jgi:beta-galactosidase
VNLRIFRSILSLLFLFSIPALQLCATGLATEPRQIFSADQNWKFLLGDPSGAEDAGFSDAAWSIVNLPHDWSIASVPNPKNPGGAGEGFYPGGIGWYRKSFTAPAGWRGKRISVEFDGVYEHATVYLNGHRLGMHAYGYTSFRFDLTSTLRLGATNLLAVRVDNSAQPNSRWYSGSGIYRHVRVVVTEPVHVAHWGVFVKTPQVSSNSAMVVVETQLVNDLPDSGDSSDSAGPTHLTLETKLVDRTGRTVGVARSGVDLAAHQRSALSQTIHIVNPAVWSPDSPTLYRAISIVRTRGSAGEAVADRVETPFGIRSLVWSAERGLLLNGKPIKLHGGSVHHDNGPLGAAAFDRAEVRRVELMKAAGMNAVRTAHNPPSPAFLDACDRLGLLVLDEPFDVWEAHKVRYDYASDFDQNWKKDITSMIRRDRNHPSIIIWGIGNEIPELETIKGAPLAKQLIAAVHSLDRTRPLTLAFPGTTTRPNAAAVFSQLDITGYNYNLIPTYASDHKAFPSRLMLTTESYPSKAFPLWQISEDNAYVLGDLTWTAMDYLGESGIGAWSYDTPEQAGMIDSTMGMLVNANFIDQLFTGMAEGKDMNAAMSKGASPQQKALAAVFFHGFPWHAADCGDIDLIGNRKPQSYYRDIVWNGGDRLYTAVRLPAPTGKRIVAVGWATYPTVASWTWPGHEGQDLQVEVYSRAEKVRLYLNGKLLGEQPTGRDQQFRAVFHVPYQAGVLRTVALRDGKVVAQQRLTTTGPAARLRLVPDRSSLHADGEDLAFVQVEAVDAQGSPVFDASQDIHFSVSGPATILAAGNADQQDSSSYQGKARKLYQGRALVVLRTTTHAGDIRLHVDAAGLDSASSHLTSAASASMAELR